MERAGAPSHEVESDAAQDALSGSGAAALPGALDRVLALQRFAGNAATTRLIQRQVHGDAGVQPDAPVAPPQPPRAPGPASASGASVDATLLTARAVLNQTERADHVTREQVSRGLTALPVFRLMEERERARMRMETLTAQLGEARAAQGRPHGEHGVPLSAEEQTRVAAEIDSLSADVTRLQREVDTQCAQMGIPPERIVPFVQGIPDALENRGIQIALGQLEHNRAMAQSERNRLLGGNMSSLRAVALELDTERRRIGELRTAGRRATYDLPSGGIGPNNAAASEFSQQAQDHAAAREQELAQRTRAATLQFPVLAHVPPERIAATPEGEALDALVGGRLSEVLEDIEGTRSAVANRRISVWDLPQIVDLAWQDLGLPADESLRRVVAEHRGRQAADAAQQRMIRAAFEITATVLATMASGGLGIAVGAGLGTGRLAESVERFLGQAQAVDATMDPQIQALVSEQPDLRPVLEDLAGLVVDAGVALTALRALAAPLRELREGARVARFTQAARSALPDAAASRVIQGAVGRAANTPGALNRRIVAMANQLNFHDRDLRMMEQTILEVFDQVPSMRPIAGNMHQIEQGGYGRLLATLREQGRIRPLTRRALMDHDPLLSPADLDRYLAPQYAGWRIDGTVFIREGHAQDCMRTLVHEATHVNQLIGRQAGPRMSDFREEFQAFAMERDFTQQLGRTIGMGNLSPSNYWYATADDLELALHIQSSYGSGSHAIPGELLSSILGGGEREGYDEVVLAFLQAESNAQRGQFTPLTLGSLTGSTR